MKIFNTLKNYLSPGSHIKYALMVTYETHNNDIPLEFAWNNRTYTSPKKAIAAFKKSFSSVEKAIEMGMQIRLVHQTIEVIETELDIQKVLKSK
jgi:hypothetical protein